MIQPKRFVTEYAPAHHRHDYGYDQREEPEAAAYHGVGHARTHAAADVMKRDGYARIDALRIESAHILLPVKEIRQYGTEYEQPRRKNDEPGHPSYVIPRSGGLDDLLARRFVRLFRHIFSKPDKASEITTNFPYFQIARPFRTAIIREVIGLRRRTPFAATSCGSSRRRMSEIYTRPYVRPRRAATARPADNRHVAPRPRPNL